MTKNLYSSSSPIRTRSTNSIDLGTDLDDTTVFNDDSSGKITSTLIEKVLQQICSKLPSTRKRTQQQNIALEVAEIILPAIATLLDATNTPSCTKCEEAKAAARVCFYKADANEQYSRRESVRIFGIDEIENENLEETVKTLAAEVGQKVVEEEIVAVHRVGKIGSGQRPILCRFTRRKPGKSLLKNQKNMRQKTNNKKLFVVEDLTPMRSKLRFIVKRTEGVDKVRVRDGRILCDYKGHTTYLENPDDLFKIGIEAPNLAELGLPPPLQ